MYMSYIYDCRFVFVANGNGVFCLPLDFAIQSAQHLRAVPALWPGSTCSDPTTSWAQKMFLHMPILVVTFKHHAGLQSWFNSSRHVRQFIPTNRCMQCSVAHKVNVRVCIVTVPPCATRCCSACHVVSQCAAVYGFRITGYAKAFNLKVALEVALDWVCVGEVALIGCFLRKDVATSWPGYWATKQSRSFHSCDAGHYAGVCFQWVPSEQQQSLLVVLALHLSMDQVRSSQVVWQDLLLTRHQRCWIAAMSNHTSIHQIADDTFGWNVTSSLFIDHCWHEYSDSMSLVGCPQVDRHEPGQEATTVFDCLGHRHAMACTTYNSLQLCNYSVVVHNVVHRFHMYIPVMDQSQVTLSSRFM